MSPVEPVYNHGPEYVQDEHVLGKEDRQETVHLRDVHVSLDITFFQWLKCLNFAFFETLCNLFVNKNIAGNSQTI